MDGVNVAGSFGHATFRIVASDFESCLCGIRDKTMSLDGGRLLTSFFFSLTTDLSITTIGAAPNLL